MEINEEKQTVLESFIGGGQQLRPDSYKKGTIMQFHVKEYTEQKTEYGTRYDFTVIDDTDEYVLSSWAILSKKKFKPSDIVGKNIQITAKDEKKFILEVMP